MKLKTESAIETSGANPRSKVLECAHRAYLLGESRSADVVPELYGLLQSDESVVRKLASSAFGKLSKLAFDKTPVVALMLRVACNDPYPQTRQYALKALAGYRDLIPTETLKEIQFVADDLLQKEYVRTAAKYLLGKCKHKAVGEIEIRQDDIAKEEVTMSHKDPSYEDVLSAPNDYVKGEQRIAWTFRTTSPMLIKGGAGSGKTIVAMLRAIYARRLAMESLWGQGNVLFLTYDKPLNVEISRVISKRGVDVMTVDAWVYRYLKEIGDDLSKNLPGRTEVNRTLDECFLQARENVFAKEQKRAVTQKSKSFYMDEISWIKGRGIETEDDYLAADRSGRGGDARLNAEDRQLIWKLKECYDKRCSEAGVEGFEDRVARAWRLIQIRGIPQEMRYDHVVVDEAQDFTYLKLKIASAIAKGESAESKGITLIADAAQEIYQSGFSWKDADIAIAGRTKIFKRNYRNTRQIAAAAYSLMAKEESRDEMTEMDLPQREGPKPQVWVSTRPGDQQEAAMLDRLKDEILSKPDSNRVVAVYATSDLKKLKEYFEKNDFNVNVKDPVGGCSFNDMLGGEKKNGLVHLRTLHHMKGLQFDHVYLWKMSKGFFPAVGNEVEDDSILRKLLYVGMTRASHTLTLCCPYLPTKFLHDIDRSLIDVIKV